MALKDWKKLEWNNSLSKDGMMWGNEKKGGMVFISKSNYPEEGKSWRFGGVNRKGYFKETRFKTKSEARSKAMQYMRSH